MQFGTLKAFVSATFLLASAGSAAASGLYFKEVTTTSGMGQASLGDGTRFVFLQGDKSRVMSKISEQAAAGKAEMKQSFATMAGNSGMADNRELRIRRIDQEIAGLEKQQRGLDMGGFGGGGDTPKRIRELKAEKARIEAGEENHEVSTRAKQMAASVDTSGKDELLASKRVIITRLDDGKIYDINAKDLTYTESSLSAEKKRRERKASKMQAPKEMTVAMEETGETQTVAGHACKAYKIVASMRGAGGGTPLITGTYWAAEDLADVGREYAEFDGKFMAEVGPDPDNPLLQIINSKMDWARDFREKAASIKGMVLKRELQMTPPDIGAMAGGMAGMGGVDIQAKMAAAMKGMPSMGGMGGMFGGSQKGAAGGAGMGGPMSAIFEIVEVTPGPVSPKQFELQDGLKKK